METVHQSFNGDFELVVLVGCHDFHGFSDFLVCAACSTLERIFEGNFQCFFFVVLGKEFFNHCTKCFGHVLDKPMR